ncbi:adenine-specific DNA-methyltransferase [Caballeronia arationis]|uniref:site-specific DNA-methyltransferase (adenine-specific) n=1 Tax=Caballeronia arationis TaxID=1777142 RepID=A0A7Z7N3W4_9BURK|nr:site-specific DNA-methyltransferase [Caballeronia arationis]SOE81311.1 adenine-specific DNA-methyltransferase [Caballeronia arationis]
MQNFEAHSPETQSADLIADNIARLKSLFPELLTEGANGAEINVDVLRQLVGDIAADGEEKYGLNWHGKRRARQMALTPSTGTLRPCVEDSVDWLTTKNLMIEGDNLEVLKLLQKSYAGQIKLIYIDPPYNTGSDFVYPDNFQDNIQNYLELTGQVESGRKISSNTEASGRFHTDWLNMIYPRLKLSYNLLSIDGVILVSIDEHEITNLRRVMDELFGEENFISCLTWEKGRKNDAKFFSNGHEYVVVYAKSQGRLREIKTLWREEKPGARDIWEEYLSLRTKHGDKQDLIEKDLQAWYANLPKAHPAKKWSRYKRVDQHGPWRDRDISWPGGGGPRYDVLHPVTHQPCAVPERGWIYSTPEEMQRQIKAGLVEFRADHTEPPFRKAHIRPIPQEIELTEAVDEVEEDESEEDEEEQFATQVRGSYFYKQSQVSVKYLRTLLGKKVFNNPKDTDEIGRLIRYTTSDDPNAIVLDFFAGSGTTGEAVIRLNCDDGARRRYIMVQLPEPLDPTAKEQKVAAKFCDEIGRPRYITELTKERLRRASAKISAERPEWKGDVGFRVFKLDTSNIRAWNPNRDDLPKTLLDHAEHILPDRTEADIVYELLLKLGLDLCIPMESRDIAGKTVGSIGGGVLMACLSEKITREDVEPLAQGIVAWHKELAPASDTTCVFRDNAFADDVAKTNLAAILEQYGIQNVRSL